MLYSLVHYSGASFHMPLSDSAHAHGLSRFVSAQVFLTLPVGDLCSPMVGLLSSGDIAVTFIPFPTAQQGQHKEGDGLSRLSRSWLTAGSSRGAQGDRCKLPTHVTAGTDVEIKTGMRGLKQ